VRRGAALAAALWGGLSLPGCSGSDPKTDASKDSAATDEGGSVPGLRATHDAWVRLDSADDPYFEPGMDEVDCSPVGWKAESGFFEIESDLCSRATWEQPLLAALRAGDELGFLFWHLDLWADPPYQASVELSVENAVLWRYEVQVPSSENVEEVVVTVPADLAEGAPVRLHLDNHGVNSWRLGDLAVGED
jgi:hypothetical protein